MNKTSYLLPALALVAVALFSAQCGGSKPAGEAAAPAPAASSANADTIYTADVKGSEIVWKGSKLYETSSHTGNIQLKSGTMGFKDGAPVSGTFEIDMASITNTDLTDPEYNARLVGHLKNEDFFDVTKFPTAKFELVSASAGSKPGEYNVTGNLTIKDVTQTISGPATIATTDNGATTEATVTFDRTQFGVRYGSENHFADLAQDRVIDDKVEITLKVALSK